MGAPPGGQAVLRVGLGVAAWPPVCALCQATHLACLHLIACVGCASRVLFRSYVFIFPPSHLSLIPF